MAHKSPVTIYESLSTRSLARLLDGFEDTGTLIRVVLDDYTLIGTVKEVERGLLTLSTVYVGGNPQPDGGAAQPVDGIQPLAFIPIDKILFIENVQSAC